VNATQRYAWPLGLRDARSPWASPKSPANYAVGFASGAEVMLAQYRHGRDAGVLLLKIIHAQLAECIRGTWRRRSRKRKECWHQDRAHRVAVVDGDHAKFATYADTYGTRDVYTRYWNEPSQTATDPHGLGSVSHLLRTGISWLRPWLGLPLAACGYSRALVARKVFDRHDRLECCRWIVGKTIDTRDCTEFMAACPASVGLKRPFLESHSHTGF